jgi:hypothetical protein
MAHSGSPVLARAAMEGCVIVDVLPSILCGFCDACGNKALLPEFQPASRCDYECVACHVRLCVTSDGLMLARLTAGRSKAGVDASRGSKKGHKARGPGLTAGQPLEKQGVCKHYKRSHR